jgi:hypothetical protein
MHAMANNGNRHLGDKRASYSCLQGLTREFVEGTDGQQGNTHHDAKVGDGVHNAEGRLE